MPVETLNAADWIGTGTSNATNIGDDNPTSYALVQALGTWALAVIRSGTVTSWETKSQTWSDYKIKITNLSAAVTSVNWGAGGYLLDASYSTDTGNNWTPFPSGPSNDQLDTGVYTLDSGTISGNPTTSSIQVRIRIQSDAGSQDSGNRISGDLCVASVGEIYLEGTYSSAPTVTSLNSGSACSIGDTGVSIVGTNFTGATSVSINGVSASYSVTNDTTISVTIPVMGNYGSGKSVSVTGPGGTGSANVGNINTPTVSAISPAITNITAGTTEQFSSTISLITPNTPHWYATQQNATGSITSDGLWTAPTSLLSNGYGCSISVWPSALDAWGVPVATLSVNVYYAPIATSLVPSTATPAFGSTFTITPTYSNNNGTPTLTYSGDSSGSITCPASGVATGSITANWTGSRTYLLTVSNVPGATATTSVTITPQTVYLYGPYGIANYTTVAGNSNNSGIYCYVTGGNTNNINWSCSGGSFDTSPTASYGTTTWTAPATSGTYTITATSVDDASKTTTYTIYVTNTPTISSFTASDQYITTGQSTNLLPVFTNPNPGSARIGTTSNGTEVTSTAVSGNSYSVSPTSQQIYYLRVISSDTSYVEETVTVYVYAAAVATSLTPSTTSPLYGATITLTPVFSGGSPGSLVKYIGSSGNQSYDVTSNATSGSPSTSGAITSAKTFTLSVRNDAGDWVYATSSLVTPQTVVVADITPATPTIVGETTGNQFTSSVSGAANTGITWTFKNGGTDVGTITAGQGTNTVTWTAPTNAQTVTCTATAQANGTTNKTTSITVTQAPAVEIKHSVVSTLFR